MENAKNDPKKRSPLNALAENILTYKYIAAAWAAAVIAAAAAVIDGSEIYTLAKAIAAALILTLSSCLMSLRLLKLGGMKREDMRRLAKSIDPRLNDSLEDIGGIGSILGVAAAVTAAFSEIFIVNGGVFSEENLLPKLLSAAASAIATGASVSAITSLPLSVRTVGILCARMFPEKTPDRSVSRFSHYPDAVRALREIFSVRITACAAFCVSIIICSLSGASSPFSCTEAALLAVSAVAASMLFTASEKGEQSEVKTPLWNKSFKSFCALSIFIFQAVAVLFIFSFPIRSVYTEYTVQYDFEYHDEIDAEIDILSVPTRDDSTAPLFLGYFTVCSMLAPVAASVLCYVKGAAAEGEKRGISGVCLLLCAFVTVVYPVGAGLFYPAARMDIVMWTVSVSVGCLFATLCFIAALICIRRKRKQ